MVIPMRNYDGIDAAMSTKKVQVGVRMR